jgi:CBS domain-containing protein
MITIDQLLKSKPHQEIFAVNPTQSTYEALQMMAARDVGAIAVMHNGELLGILIEREYARRIVLCGKTSRHTPVGETMNREFQRIAPTSTLDDCMRLMSQQRCRYVAVMDGDRLLGLISIGDVIKQMIADQQASIDHLERYITGI